MSRPRPRARRWDYSTFLVGEPVYPALPLHVFQTLRDRLGSASVVIDHEVRCAYSTPGPRPTSSPSRVSRAVSHRRRRPCPSDRPLCTLRRRYHPPMAKGDRAAMILHHLANGGPLDGLGIGRVDGRLDLRDLSAPRPSVVGKRDLSFAKIKELGDLIQVEGRQWMDLDLSGSSLESVRFLGGTIVNCKFDRSKCKDLRMWDTSVVDTSFVGANLRGAVLGPVAQNGKRNQFVNVDFSGADLRNTVWQSAEARSCAFRRANLKNVKFNGTVFVDCRFEGRLEDVQFARHAFGYEALPPNDMCGVDFSSAEFHFVDFRRLDMGSVAWPSRDDHYLIEDYRTTLSKMIEVLRGRGDTVSARLRSMLEMLLKWAGEAQVKGVVSTEDLIASGGAEAVTVFTTLLRSVGARLH